MVGSCPRRLEESEDLKLTRVLVSAFAARRHELGEERRVVDVEFVGGDAHDGAIAGVHVADAEDVLAAQPEVIIEFVSERDCGKTRPGKIGQRMEEEAVGVESCEVEEEGGGEGGDGPCCDNIEGGGGGGRDVEGCHCDDCCSHLCLWDEGYSWVMVRALGWRGDAAAQTSDCCNRGFNSALVVEERDVRRISA